MISVGKFQETRLDGRLRRKWKRDINYIEEGYEDMTELAQDWVQWWAFVNTAMKLWGPYKEGVF
jgi:hypothetical protein